MALRSLSKLKIYKEMRTFSSDAKLLSIIVNDKTGVSTLNLERPPVNGLNLELLSEMSSALSDLEKNKSRGLILTAKKDGIFSAGLDITEMYKTEKDRLKVFWTTLQDIWIKLYWCSFPSVALINGHAPAGGCLLALSCEYRVMFKDFTIGLNETQLGLVAPQWLISTMKNVIGHRQTELALTTGNMFTTDEAFKIGLVDEVVENKEEGLARAEAFLCRFKRIPVNARTTSKKYIRDETIETMIKNREKDLNDFLRDTLHPDVQKILGAFFQRKKPSKA